MTLVLATRLNTVTALPCEIQKSLFWHLQQWIHTG